METIRTYDLSNNDGLMHNMRHKVICPSVLVRDRALVIYHFDF